MVTSNIILTALALFSVSPHNMPSLLHGDEIVKTTLSFSSISSYGARTNYHPTAYNNDPAFKGPLILDQKELSNAHRVRIHRHYQIENMQYETNMSSIPTKLGASTSTTFILKSIIDHLARREAPVDAKEVAESVEFYLRCGKRLIGAAKRVMQNNSNDDDHQSNNEKNAMIIVQDLCSGHGLTGLIFLACNPPGRLPRKTNMRIISTDQFRPQSHSILKECISEICPWVADEGAIIFNDTPLEDFTTSYHNSLEKMPGNQATIVLSTHACGVLTDKVLQYAMQIQAASLAVMPCCYTGTDSGVPFGVRRMLGVGMSADIRRCFELQERGYHTDFAAIPRAVTAMNRIIVAERRR